MFNHHKNISISIYHHKIFFHFLFTDSHMSPKPGVLSPKTSTQFSINILRTLQKKDPVMGLLDN